MTYEYMKAREEGELTFQEEERKRQEQARLAKEASDKAAQEASERAVKEAADKARIDSAATQARIDELNRQAQKAAQIAALQDSQTAQAMAMLQQTNPSEAARLQEALSTEQKITKSQVNRLQDIYQAERRIEDIERQVSRGQATVDTEAFEKYKADVLASKQETAAYYETVSKSIAPYVTFDRDGNILVDVVAAVRRGVPDDKILKTGLTQTDIDKAKVYVQELRDYDEKLKTYREFTKTNVELPDGNWINRDNLNTIKETQPEVYELITQKGVNAANEYINRRNENYYVYKAAQDKLSGYTVRKLDDSGKIVNEVDVYRYLRDYPHAQQILRDYGFSDDSIKAASDYVNISYVRPTQQERFVKEFIAAGGNPLTGRDTEKVLAANPHLILMNASEPRPDKKLEPDIPYSQWVANFIGVRWNDPVYQKMTDAERRAVLEDLGIQEYRRLYGVGRVAASQTMDFLKGLVPGLNTAQNWDKMDVYQRIGSVSGDVAQAIFIGLMAYRLASIPKAPTGPVLKPGAGGVGTVPTAKTTALEQVIKTVPSRAELGMTQAQYTRYLQIVAANNKVSPAQYKALENLFTDIDTYLKASRTQINYRDAFIQSLSAQRQAQIAKAIESGTLASLIPQIAADVKANPELTQIVNDIIASAPAIAPAEPAIRPDWLPDEPATEPEISPEWPDWDDVPEPIKVPEKPVTEPLPEIKPIPEKAPTKEPEREPEEPVIPPVPDEPQRDVPYEPDTKPIEPPELDPETGKPYYPDQPPLPEEPVTPAKPKKEEEKEPVPVWWPKPDEEDAPIIEPDKEPDTGPEVTPVTKPETPEKAEPDITPEVKPETKPEEKPDTEKETETEPKPDTEPDTEPETKPDTKEDTETKVVPAITPDTKTETGAAIETDTETKEETATKTATEIETATKTDDKTQLAALTQTQTETDTAIQTEPEVTTAQALINRLDTFTGGKPPVMPTPPQTPVPPRLEDPIPPGTTPVPPTDPKKKRLPQQPPSRTAPDEEKREYIKQQPNIVVWPQGEIKAGKVWHVVTYNDDGSNNRHFNIVGKAPEGGKVYSGPREAYKEITQVKGRPPKNPVTLEGGAVDPTIYKKTDRDPGIVFKKDRKYHRRAKAVQSSIAPDVVEVRRGNKVRRHIKR